MLEIKTIVTEMKNAHDRLISRPDTVKEKINKLKGISVDASKTERQREKKTVRGKSRISKNCRTTTATNHIKHT